MAFTINSKVPAGRVRVTERVESEPDAQGARTLVARQGAILSLQEAVRLDLPESILEPVGHGGEVALAAYRQARDGDDSEVLDVASVEAEATEAEATADEEAEYEYPVHRGGPNWTLSNGETFRGSREAATDAQAELDDDAEE